jgi:diguanylate cyclase (GGDEF)-like protein
MDVQSLELNTGLSLPSPRPGRRDPARDIDLARPKPDGGGDQTGDDAVASTRGLLLAYTAASILLGLGALAWTTLTVPLLPAIDPGLDGTSLAGPAGGLLLWIAFGLVGSLRVLPIPGSSAVWTFHFPFIAAAMVLGGPTAGAWVAFLATLERRELESQPWYGTLANHAVLALGAVVGGLTVLVAKGALVAVGADAGAANVLAIALGTVVLAVTVNGLAAVTIILRERLAPMALVDILVRSLGRVTLAEIGLASVFAVSYVAIGWWAPLALAIVVLVIWPGEGFEGLDPLMKLPRNRQFQRELESAVARTRRGLAPGGLLLMIDLDGFGQINKDVGKHAGDEVLAEIGDRLRALARRTDLVGRLGGDELAMYYSGSIDFGTAIKLARAVEDAIRRPIATSAGALRVGVSIGALLVRPSSDIPASSTLLIWADREMQAQKKAQKAGRTQKGIRFHAYGLSTPPSSATEPDRAPRRWSIGPIDRLEVAAVVVAGLVVAMTAAAWVLRLAT